MPTYKTAFPRPGMDGGFIETQLFARSPAHANELIRRRKLGETYIDLYHGEEVLLPSELWARDDKLEAVHAAVWLSSIAVRSGTVSGFDLLIDGGIIHEMVHCVEPKIVGAYSPHFLRLHYDRVIKPRLLKLEQTTPGFQRFESKASEQARDWYRKYDSEAYQAPQKGNGHD